MLSSNTSAVSGDATYIEDVFSTYLYTGTGATQTITNNIDLSTKGGMLWIKDRTIARNNVLNDTVRGPDNNLYSNTTGASITTGTGLSAFTTSGFSFNGGSAQVNSNGETYASWTFRKQPKFFDVVTYTGNGTTQNIAHSLGATPGCIIVKRTDAVENWGVYHRSIGNTGALRLNQTAATSTLAAYWNNTSPTSTQFTVGSDTQGNASGGTYVAYIFAHNAGGFGLTGTDNVISCGSYAGTGAEQTINLGFEPQFVLLKRSSGTSNWFMYDTMRGLTYDAAGNYLLANTTGAEGSASNYAVGPVPNGFRVFNADTNNNASGSTYIYIAIRRGPMKVPTDATKVFSPTAAAGNATVTTNFPVDLSWTAFRSGDGTNVMTRDRLQGLRYLSTSDTAAESSYSAISGYKNFASNTTIDNSVYGSSSAAWLSLRRAPSFFDVVCYTGNGASRSITHNLSVSPELVIIKSRSDAQKWQVSSSALGFSVGLSLNETTAANGGYANVTGVSSTTFSVINDGTVNGSGQNYVAYLFATCAGVSKVGSYTGTGTTKQIDCGFAAGARFVLIKRTDSTGDWYVWDTARGIIAGNDPYLLLNSAAAEVTITDYIDTYSAGFELSTTAAATVNVIGGSYIFLAIA